MKHLRNVLSVIIIIIIIVISSFSVFGESTTEQYKYKLDTELVRVLEDIDNDTEIQVSVWFQDIDHSVIKKEIETNNHNG